MVDKIKDLLGLRFVWLDAKDNSIVFSRGLVRFMRKQNHRNMSVLVLKIKGTEDYGFLVGHSCAEVKDDVKLPNIQYDSKGKHYGFNSFSPAVARLAWEWNHHHDACWTSRVTISHIADGQVLYIIHKS